MGQPYRTVFCPAGCHEDYLQREAFNSRDKVYGAHYICYRCEWRATWNNLDGFQVITISERHWDDSYQPWGGA